MKIIEPSFEITYFQDNALEVIERAGRVCYLSEPKGRPDHFVKKLINMNHHTPLEMAHATVELVCDLGVSHEIVRHRLASFNQSSTRYCNYSKEKFGKEITVIRPFFYPKYSRGHKEWIEAMRFAEEKYMNLLEFSTPEQARTVLPKSLATNIIVNCNFREWRHIFNLRTNMTAHPQMVELMKPLKAEFAKRLPVVFGDN